MRVNSNNLAWAVIVASMAVPAAAQAPPAAIGDAADALRPASQAAQAAGETQADSAGAAASVAELLNGAALDVKFDVRDLMEILRDHRHEGWVLAAYPDPKTGQPLIGAGVSLDLPVREHPQNDPENPHGFLEPSSADLWQAAGLNPARLRTILGDFDRRMAVWNKKGFRKRIRTLEPEITDEEATLLLRVSALQAIYNAKGYCRCFDRLTGPQQMALSQLVYQMGVNLAEFNQFLTQMNNYSGRGDGDTIAVSTVAEGVMDGDAAYWKTVQQSLVQSQWARLYRVRAVAVIAMLDPQYADGPGLAEQRVGAMLRPAVVERRRGRQVAATRIASPKEPAGKRSPSKGRSRGAGRRSTLQQRRKRGV